MRRHVRGLIGYFRRGEQTGLEHFSITTEADGARTLRAECEMWDDALVRDVTLAVDRDYWPQDAFIRLTQHGRFVGTIWFLFGDGYVSCESRTAREDRVSQRIEWPGWPPCFGTHSLITDAWHAHFWRGQDPPLMRSPVSSNAANGGTGPLIGTTRFQLRRLGAQTVQVPAGEFSTSHFAIEFGDYPPLHFWSRDDDHQFVRMEWDHIDAHYELLELKESRR